MNNIVKADIDASVDYVSPWYRRHENFFFIEVQADSLDAVDGAVYLEVSMDKTATEGIELDDSRITLNSPDKHIALRNATPIMSDWIRLGYDAGTNTLGTISFKGNV